MLVVWIQQVMAYLATAHETVVGVLVQNVDDLCKRCDVDAEVDVYDAGKQTFDNVICIDRLMI